MLSAWLPQRMPAACWGSQALARFRARDQLTELPAANLHSIAEEAAAFLNQVMGYDFSPAVLEAHTEEWWCGARPNFTAGA